jgi:anti-sigma factor RsiW
MAGHVIDDLAAYAEDQLEVADRERVARHLQACDDCRHELERIRHGIELASQLTAEPMPADVAARIRSRIASAVPDAVDRTIARRGAWWRAAAAVILLGAGVALFWQVNRPWVRLDAAAPTPTRFEREGRQLHDQLVTGAMPLAFVSSDERALWQWLDSQGAPVTSMRVVRPADERTQFVPLGAAVRTIDGATTSVVSYRIDGRPVTLALAMSRDVPDAPPAGWWTKRVMHRRDSGGANTLTWTIGGGTYVMVSELDGAGQRACLICHTAPTFRDRIRDLRP